MVRKGKWLFYTDYRQQNIKNALFKIGKDIALYSPKNLKYHKRTTYRYYNKENNTFNLSRKELKMVKKLLRDNDITVRDRKRYGYIVIGGEFY
nr:MAG TPA: hypothetical protein [Herelleviridae sp.]